MYVAYWNNSLTSFWTNSQTHLLIYLSGLISSLSDSGKCTKRISVKKKRISGIRSTIKKSLSGGRISGLTLIMFQTYWAVGVTYHFTGLKRKTKNFFSKNSPETCFQKYCIKKSPETWYIKVGIKQKKPQTWNQKVGIKK